MTADAVETFLRQHQFPVESDKGGMCQKLYTLCCSRLSFLLLVALLGGKDKGQVPEDEKMTFYTQSELNVRHPLSFKLFDHTNGLCL